VSEPLHTTLSDLADFLEQHAVPFAVIGGIAAGVHGEPRFTADVDVVIGVDVDRALTLIDALESSPFRPLFPRVAEVVRTAFILPLRHRETQIKVDLAIGLSGFEKQLIARATSTKLADRLLPVATAEDLIVLKMLAARPRDADDVVRIVARQGGTLDRKYLIETAELLQQALAQDILSPLRRLLSDDDPNR
jgi:hypothetical protein